MNTQSSPWQQKCNDITSALRYMLEHEIVVDAIFKKNKISCLYAHKLVLAMWSPKFAKWIKEMDKSQTFSITFDEDEDVMQTIIRYLYSSDDLNPFSKMPLEKLIQALEISERFEIVHVYKTCLKILRKRKICPSNVINYLDFGLRKNMKDTEMKCIEVCKRDGICLGNINGDFSVATILKVLTLDKIAVSSEADLLHFAIKWLSCPQNNIYKSEVLSCIDLQSVDWREYQNICQKFPAFFSNSELSSIILGMLRQDTTLFPAWYQSKIKSTIEKNYSSRTFVRKAVRIPRKFPQLTADRLNLKYISQEVQFQFKYHKTAKLVSVELGFGPNEVSSNEFKLYITKNGVRYTNYFSIEKNLDLLKNKYNVKFEQPITIKSKDKLILKFYFRQGLVFNRIKTFSLNSTDRRHVNKAMNKDIIKIKLTSPKLAFYVDDNNVEKFLILSFWFYIYNHQLKRTCCKTENSRKMVDMEVEYKDKPAVKLEADVREFKRRNVDFQMNTDSKNRIHETSECYTKNTKYKNHTYETAEGNILNIQIKTEEDSSAMEMDYKNPVYKTAKDNTMNIPLKIEEDSSTMDMDYKNPLYKTAKDNAVNMPLKTEEDSSTMDMDYKNSLYKTAEVNILGKPVQIDYNSMIIKQEHDYKNQIISRDSIFRLKQELIDLTEDLTDDL